MLSVGAVSAGVRDGSPSRVLPEDERERIEAPRVQYQAKLVRPDVERRPEVFL